jgi:hypothetical protein
MHMARGASVGAVFLALVATSAAVTAEEATLEEGLLPGVRLMTVAVEPGVVKVTSDGVHDLRWTLPPVVHRDDTEEIAAAEAEALSGGVVAGFDGSIWLTWKDEVFRLGDDDTRRDAAPWSKDVGVSADGRLWRHDINGLKTFDGSVWERQFIKLPREHQLLGVQMQPDGTLWALLLRDDGKVLRVARAVDGRWRLLDWKYRKAWAGSIWPAARLEVSEDAAWVFVQGGMVRGQTADALVRLRGDTVKEIEIPNHVEAMAAGLDGTVWLDLHRSTGPTLARRDGKEWTRFKESDGVQPVEQEYSLDPRRARFDVAPDGSIWVRPAVDDDETGQTCRGLADFDGKRWREFLTDRCIYAMDIAPDGRVWALGGTRESWPGVWTEDLVLPGGTSPTGPVELYVIDPDMATT